MLKRKRICSLPDFQSSSLQLSCRVNQPIVVANSRRCGSFGFCVVFTQNISHSAEEQELRAPHVRHLLRTESHLFDVLCLEINMTLLIGRQPAAMRFWSFSLIVLLALLCARARAQSSEWIIDNTDASVVRLGRWVPSTAVPGYWGSNFLHDRATNKGKSVRYPLQGEFALSTLEPESKQL
jgi:hypothetical protein